jgi:hypothetical protein
MHRERIESDAELGNVLFKLLHEHSQPELVSELKNNFENLASDGLHLHDDQVLLLDRGVARPQPEKAPLFVEVSLVDLRVWGKERGVLGLAREATFCRQSFLSLSKRVLEISRAFARYCSSCYEVTSKTLLR